MKGASRDLVVCWLGASDRPGSDSRPPSNEMQSLLHTALLEHLSKIDILISFLQTKKLKFGTIK